MAEAEQPERRRPGHVVTVDDVRQLMGASTPHFALQIRNRIRKLIAPLPPEDPARLLGEQEIARLDAAGLRGRVPGRRRAAGAAADAEPGRGRADALRGGSGGLRCLGGSPASVMAGTDERQRRHCGSGVGGERLSPRARLSGWRDNHRRSARNPYMSWVPCHSLATSPGTLPLNAGVDVRGAPAITPADEGAAARLPPRPAPGERLAVGRALPPRPCRARRAPRRVRRPVVPRPGDELRDEHGEDDLAGELRVRPVSGLGTQGPDEERAEIVPHPYQACHIARIPLRRLVRSIPMSPDPRPEPGRPGGDLPPPRDLRPQPGRPDGIPGSGLSGPWPVGQYAERLRDRLRSFSRVQVFGEVFNLRPGRARVWFELRDERGALPCSMWREDFDRAGDPARRRPAGGGRRRLRLLPRLAGGLALVLLRGGRRARRGRGRPARAARPAAPRAPRRGAVRAAEAAADPAAAALHRRRHGRGRQGARRHRRRPAPARLGGPRRVGVRARPGPPRGARRSPGRSRTSPRARRSRS